MKKPSENSHTASWILSSVGSQFASLPTRMSKQIKASSEKKIAKLCQYGIENIREWQGNSRECSREFMWDRGGFTFHYHRLPWQKLDTVFLALIRREAEALQIIS